MPPQQINIDQLPKQFCENIIVGSNNQTFILVTTVGANATAYAITPEHAKNLARILTEHVEQFEKNIRPIADISQGVKSPLQTTDLGPDAKGDSKK